MIQVSTFQYQLSCAQAFRFLISYGMFSLGLLFSYCFLNVYFYMTNSCAIAIVNMFYLYFNICDGHSETMPEEQDRNFLWKILLSVDNKYNWPLKQFVV